MDVMTSGVALVVVSVIVTLAVLAAFLWRRRNVTRARPFLGLATAAAVSSVCSSLFYVIFFTVLPERGVLAAGDAAMVLSPALLWLAVSTLNRRGPWRAVAVAAAGVGMFVLSMMLSEDIASAIKLVLLIVFCGVLAAEARLGRARRTRGTLAIAAIMVAYALYSLGRLVFLSLDGLDGVIYVLYFSTGPTTVVGVVTVILLAFGVLRAAQDDRQDLSVARHSVRDRLALHAGTMLAETGAVSWRVASVDDLDLIRESFGDDYVREVERALIAASQDCTGGVSEVGLVGPGRVVVVCDAAAPEVTHEELRRRFAQASERLRETYVPDLDLTAARVESQVALAAVVARS